MAICHCPGIHSHILIRGSSRRLPFIFHPLAHIDGPRLAAATHLYVFYYNGIRSGKLYLQTKKLHLKYDRQTLQTENPIRHSHIRQVR
ncbi:hypothetical protein PABG_11482 [Paracoccidioides brasiliensis Pb03]|nr:hypothetical protein PABG_11482 [Paracoccidioides brasiliensis Pb03]